MNPSSWSRSTSSCSGMPAPGSMSTTLIPNALRPSPRRASAHPPVRSNSSTCMIVNRSASGMVSLREDVGGPVGALPVGHRGLRVRPGDEARALDQLVVVDVARAVGEDLADVDADDLARLLPARQQRVVERDGGGALQAQPPAALEVDEQQAGLGVDDRVAEREEHPV